MSKKLVIIPSALILSLVCFTCFRDSTKNQDYEIVEVMTGYGEENWGVIYKEDEKLYLRFADAKVPIHPRQERRVQYTHKPEMSDLHKQLNEEDFPILVILYDGEIDSVWGIRNGKKLR